MLRKAVVIGGLGQMGTLVSGSLGDSGIAVTVVDVRTNKTATEWSGVEFVQGDVSALSQELREAIASADCVWVCLPEKITLQIAAGLASAMPDGCLWVDTLSVKADIVGEIERERGRLEALSINPMFAPRMGWTGNPVAVVEVLAGPKSVFLKDLVTAWGCRLELVTAEEHDRLSAGIQVATHAAILAFGAALLHLQVDVEKTLRLSTPPYRLLLTLLHRMTTQSSDVYWDIQAYHPLASDVREQMTIALGRLEQDAGTLDARGIGRMFAKLTLLLESKEGLFEKWAKQAFEMTRYGVE
jgi:prephenate dehydrogenase